MKLTSSEIAELNNSITHYENFAEYGKAENYDSEEFKESLSDGYIQEITCGTYNGATNTFTPWEMTEANIVEMVFIDMQETDFINSMDYDNLLNGVNTLYQQLEFYLTVYEVFTFGNRLFIKRD